MCMYKKGLFYTCTYNTFTITSSARGGDHIIIVGRDKIQLGPKGFLTELIDPYRYDHFITLALDVEKYLF